MPGTWTKVADNCTSYTTLFVARCEEWASNIISTCEEWATNEIKVCDQEEDQGYNECSHYVDEGHDECTSWGWFSWLCEAWHHVEEWVCDAWTWVSHVVCVAWHYVAEAVCVAAIWVVQWLCVAWDFITLFYCNNKPDGGTMFLLTDGSVMINEMVSEYGTKRWWKLSPDANGSYINGNWSRLADSHVARKYWASAVLNDGRVIICGGEYSDSSGTMKQDETNRSEIYDPASDTWTEINPPAGWTNIGDGACAVLGDGRFIIGNAFDANTAILDPVAGNWSANIAKNNRSSEESFLLLSDGTVVTANCFGHPAAEKFIPAALDTVAHTDRWMVDQSVPTASDLVEDASKEIGCSILLPDGRGFFAGATSNTAFYTLPATPTAQGTWQAGPIFPQVQNRNLGIKDGPGCLMPNGNILLGAAPVDGQNEDYLSPTSFFEFDGSSSFIRTSDPPTNNVPVYKGRMLLIPTGQVLYAVENSSDIYAYTSTTERRTTGGGKPNIATCPTQISAGTTVKVSGTMFHGLSGAVGYGDDSSAWTNYPIVRIQNRKTGRIRYCRTSHHTRKDASGNDVPSMGVATGPAVITTNVEVPRDIEKGESNLFVVANGIPSDPFSVNIV